MLKAKAQDPSLEPSFLLCNVLDAKAACFWVLSQRSPTAIGEVDKYVELLPTIKQRANLRHMYMYMYMFMYMYMYLYLYLYLYMYMCMCMCMCMCMVCVCVCMRAGGKLPEALARCIRRGKGVYSICSSSDFRPGKCQLLVVREDWQAKGQS